MKDMMHRCAYLLDFFAGNYDPFEHRSLFTIKYTCTSETVHQHNSSEIAQQNFM